LATLTRKQWISLTSKPIVVMWSMHMPKTETTYIPKMSNLFTSVL